MKEKRSCKYGEYCLCWTCNKKQCREKYCAECLSKNYPIHDIWACQEYERKEELRYVKPELTINQMTKEDFANVAVYKQGMLSKWPLQIEGVVIIPRYDLNAVHDSGYRCMDIVLVNNDNKPICRIDTYSDIVELQTLVQNGRDKMLIPQWRMDCLLLSGYLHIFTYEHVFIENEKTLSLKPSEFKIQAKW